MVLKELKKLIVLTNEIHLFEKDLITTAQTHISNYKCAAEIPNIYFQRTVCAIHASSVNSIVIILYKTKSGHVRKKDGLYIINFDDNIINYSIDGVYVFITLLGELGTITMDFDLREYDVEIGGNWL